MKCGKVRKNLMAYHDGELERSVEDKVARHLETCLECGGFLDSMKKADHAAGMAEIPAPDSPYWEDFTDRVMGRVREESIVRVRELKKVPGRSWFSPVRFAPALSVALVVVVAAGVLMKIREPAEREQAVFEPHAVVGKDVSAVPGERRSTELEGRAVVENKEAEVFVAPDEIVSEPETSAVIEKPKAGETAPATLADSLTLKKEAAAGERAPLAQREEEAVALFAEKDDSAMPDQPPTAGLTSPRALMTVPSRELSTDLQEEKGFIPAESAQDGSWGQLAFARRLEEEGNHAESEEVLNDLLARSPSGPVQEEASILLVSVLSNQNRLPEARQVLEDAQRQYPKNMMIQNYQLENGE